MADVAERVIAQGLKLTTAAESRYRAEHLELPTSHGIGGTMRGNYKFVAPEGMGSWALAVGIHNKTPHSLDTVRLAARLALIGLVERHPSTFNRTVEATRQDILRADETITLKATPQRKYSPAHLGFYANGKMQYLWGEQTQQEPYKTTIDEFMSLTPEDLIIDPKRSQEVLGKKYARLEKALQGLCAYHGVESYESTVFTFNVGEDRTVNITSSKPGAAELAFHGDLPQAVTSPSLLTSQIYMGVLQVMRGHDELATPLTEIASLHASLGGSLNPRYRLYARNRSLPDRNLRKMSIGMDEEREEAMIRVFEQLCAYPEVSIMRSPSETHLDIVASFIGKLPGDIYALPVPPVDLSLLQLDDF